MPDGDLGRSRYELEDVDGASGEGQGAEVFFFFFVVEVGRGKK